MFKSLCPGVGLCFVFIPDGNRAFPRSWKSRELLNTPFLQHQGIKAPNYSSSLGGLVILAAREANERVYFLGLLFVLGLVFF